MRHYFDPMKKFMTAKEAVSLFSKDSLVGLSEKEAVFFFGMSKMSNDQETSEYRKYQVIQQVELLEMIARVADFKFADSGSSLTEKLELLLDELFPFVGFQRRPVLIDVDENSESDDEY